jgi:hypothetical protein
MSATKMQAAIIEVIAGTMLIIAGTLGTLVRLGVLDFSRVPQWTAVEHWWPLLVIIAGLMLWLGEMEECQATVRTRRSMEIPYGK